MVFSFQHYLSFVERFVENMLSRKYLMFNTSFIIFNNSTKIRGVLSVIFMNRTHPPTSKNVMLMLQYLFTTVRQRQANKQARGHSTKGGCSSIELQDNDTTFLFCPVQSLEDGGTKPSCPVRVYTEAKGNNHRKAIQRLPNAIGSFQYLLDLRHRQ